MIEFRDNSTEKENEYLKKILLRKLDEDLKVQYDLILKLQDELKEIELLEYIRDNGKVPQHNSIDKCVDVRDLEKIFTYECIKSCSEKGYIESDMAYYDGAAPSYKLTDFGFQKIKFNI